MFSTHPKMAKRWAAHTAKGGKLPDHVDERDDTARVSGDQAPLPSLWDFFGQHTDDDSET